jgi:hypothetical protein
LTIEERVPRKDIEQIFGCIMVCSPPIYRKIVQSIADKHGVPVEELKPWVARVLREMPPRNLDDF